MILNKQHRVMARLTASADIAYVGTLLQRVWNTIAQDAVRICRGNNVAAIEMCLHQLPYSVTPAEAQRVTAILARCGAQIVQRLDQTLKLV
jgi:hypothetical protein